MDFARKLDISRMAIASIAEHDDAAPEVRRAVLDQVQVQLDTARRAIDARVRAQIEAALGPQPDKWNPERVGA